MKKILSHKFFPYLLLLVIIIFTYINALNHPFMLDDHDFFDTRKSDIRNLLGYFLPDNLSADKSVAKSIDAYYRPLAHVVPMISHLIFKGNPWGYHIVNLLLFWIACCLIFIFVENFWPNRKWGIWVAGLYALHPINGIVVNYITASVFSMQVILMIISIMTYYTWSKNHSKWGNLLISLISFLGSLMCHETAIAVPLYIASLLFISNQRRDLKLFFNIIPIFTLTIIYLLWRMSHASLNTSILSHYDLFHMSIPEYIATTTQLFAWYLSKLVYPVGIVIIYCLDVTRTHLWIPLFFAISALGITFLVLWKYHVSKNEIGAVGVLWLLIGLVTALPACLFQPTRGMIIEPHWFIFSSIGFFLIIASHLNFLLERFVKPLFIALIGFWFVISLCMNHVWENEERYCFYWLYSSPQYKAVHFHLAQYYQINQRYDLAEQNYWLGTTSHPKDMYRVYFNLGLIELNKGNTTYARTFFEKATTFGPSTVDLINNIGATYLKERDNNNAFKYFKQAIQINPRAVWPRMNLARLYLRVNKVEEAKSLYSEILKENSTYLPALINLLKINSYQKNKEQILSLCSRIISVTQSPDELINVAFAYAMMDEKKLAQNIIQKILVTNPNYLPAIELNKKINEPPVLK